MTKLLRALIVDDEDLARQDLIGQLAKFPCIQIVGEADSVRTAVNKIEELKPDVVFLDIQMPGETGFKLYELVDVKFPVVFVTAFDDFAISAFEVNALDYLLKPVEPERLAATIDRLTEGAPKKKTPAANKFEYDDYIFINQLGKSSFVMINSIVYLNALGDYSEIYTTNKEKKLMLRSLRIWMNCLPEKYFLRIRRNIIVNINFIEKIEPLSKGAYQIYMRNIATPFITSQRYGGELRKRFLYL